MKKIREEELSKFMQSISEINDFDSAIAEEEFAGGFEASLRQYSFNCGHEAAREVLAALREKREKEKAVKNEIGEE